MINTDPPENDDTVSRHKFYTAIAASLDNNTQAMLSVVTKLEDVSKRLVVVEKDFADLKTTIKTSIKIVSVVVTLLGGAVTAMGNGVLNYTLRIETLEKTSVTEDKFKIVPEQISGLKYRMNIMEEDVSRLKK